MLNMEKTQQMTDIIHTSIPYSGIEHAVISTPIYNRLHRVLQSSLVFLTYPSNKVKRFEHSVGVMHLAGDIFFNSTCNASIGINNEDTFKEFMDKVSSELIRWRKNINFDKYSFVSTELRTQYQNSDILSAPIPNSKFYNKFHPGNLEEEKKFAFYVVFQAVRLAGLLHDVGHLPYSHILEHALKKMYLITKEKLEYNSAEEIFLSKMQRFADGDDEIHEEIGKLLVGNIRSSIIQNIVDKSDPNIYFFLATFDFAESIICSKIADNSIYSDLHLITASVLDADRLDYCTRDAFCSGVNKSIFAYERLIETYKLVKITDDEGIDKFYFCPSTKSIENVEELLRRRLNIFSTINYHHRVHKHEILLEEVISMLGIEELQSMETDYEELPYTVPLCISSIWQLISKLDSSNNWPEYQIIQLDDSWLDTLLKHKFFEKFGSHYLSLRINGNDILWNRFDELISTTKRYHSFLKRSIDFREFDKLFFLKLKDSKDKLVDYLSDKIPILNSYNDYFDKYHSFLFNYCIDTLCLTKSHKERFFKNFEMEINYLVKKSRLNINDCLLRSCMFSFGYKTAQTPLYLVDSNNNPIRIEQISSQLEIFQKERAISPIFHLYYLPAYNKMYNVYEKVDKIELLEVLATSAVETILKFKLT